jgi:hypothetical protein
MAPLECDGQDKNEPKDRMAHPAGERTLVLFNHDFDQIAHRLLRAQWPQISAGFDLFAFPSQLRLAWFDIERFAALQAMRARAQGCRAVVSHHEQFGALTAALVAERLGWPGTPVRAVLACQHKLYARQMLQRVCPQSNVPAQRWQAAQETSRLHYPVFAKPIKAAFSILAREVHSEAALKELMGFGWWESVVLNRLSHPFERVVQSRLPEAGSALGLMLERPVRAPQFNLDGYAYKGEIRPLGVVDATMYPGTNAFMRFDYPTRLRPAVVARASDVARRFLQAVGFSHGLFNMEFFYDDERDEVTVIEFNPRLASQFSDLYERVEGLNLHEMGLALAHGRDPTELGRRPATAQRASSFVYRSFAGRRALRLPNRSQRDLLSAAYPDAILVTYARSASQVARHQRLLGSCRHGILNLGGADAADLERRCEVASRLLGWTPPSAAWHPDRTVRAPLEAVPPDDQAALGHDVRFATSSHPFKTL